jgi:preprotein translocase subunit SecE
MSNEKLRDAQSDAAIPQRNNSAEVVKSGSPLTCLMDYRIDFINCVLPW